MRNTIILTVVLLLAVIGTSIYYFTDLNKEHKEAIKPLKYLPENTLLIVSLRNDEITDNIFKDFEVFDAILGFKESEQLHTFKSQLLRNDALKNYVLDSEIYISFHESGKDSLDMLYTIPTTLHIEQEDFPAILDQLDKNYQITSTDTLGQKIYSLKYGSSDSILYASYYEKILFASYAKPLLASVFDKQIKRLPDNQINYFIKNNSRNTPLSVYFPHQQLPAITKHFDQRNRGLFGRQFEGLLGQSAWNINFKQDALMLTGESDLENIAGNYLALFRNQRKTAQRLYNYFPASTAVYMNYSISDKKQFQEDLSKLLTFRKDNEKVNNPYKEAKDSIATTKLGKALGTEFALIEKDNQTNIGFITIADSSLLQNIKTELFENAEESILRFKNNDVLYNLYGDAFRAFRRPYVILITNILIFANSSSTLDTYQNDWKSRNLLIGNLGFKNFEKVQGNEANITLFVHTKNANSKIVNSLPSKYRSNFRDKDNFGFQDFYSWSMQLSGNKVNFSSRVYAIYKSKTALGATPDWTYEFENKAITRPFVFEQSDTNQFILLQELDHTIHAISPSGQKIWSTVFAGRVVGDMLQLEDRSLLLVTDRNRLYRFDTQGQLLPGFSTGIPDEPITHPTVKNMDGRNLILVPTKKKIYAFNMEGASLDLFRDMQIEGEITGPILAAGDSIAIGTSTGAIYFFDQKGEMFKKSNNKGNKNFRNPIGIWDNGNKQYTIFATDTSSRFYRLNDKPAVLQTEKWNGKHFADFKDIISSNGPELIIVDKSRLRVYDIVDSIRLAFEYNFTKDIQNRPQYFRSSTSASYIGIAAKSSNLIYLFGEEGNLLNGFPIEAQPLFYYGKINYNSGVYLLCMRRDHKLYAFKHQN